MALPLGVSPLEFCLDFWHQKTRVPGLSYGIACVIKRLAVLVQYRRVTDRRTDAGTNEQTHNDSIYRASIASRGQNEYWPVFQSFVDNTKPLSNQRCVVIVAVVVIAVSLLSLFAICLSSAAIQQRRQLG